MGSAKEYSTDRVRNVAVLGHGGSGKTTLVDALCFTSGTSRRLGDLEAGHSLTMTTAEELAHGISMQVTPAYAEWSGTKINLLDTPGYLDFTGDAIAATRVADAAVVVVNGTAGIEVGTETVWEYLEARGIPRVIFVSMMDKEHADFDKVFEDIKEHLTDKALPVEIPVGSGADFRGIINLFSERTHLYKKGTTTGEYDEADIPEDLSSIEDKWETELQETLATTDEALLERYLEGGKISREEAIDAMALAVARAEVVPVFCGSAKLTYGMQALLKKMVELFPHPGETRGESASRPGLDQEVTLHADDSEPFSALVFKTANEPHVGELSYFKIMSGQIGNGAETWNPEREVTEKLNHLSIGLGKERMEVPRLHAGDIGVVAKLKNTHTNDTLSAAERPLVLEKIAFPKPEISVAIRGTTRADDDKLGEVLHRLHEEDPTFHGEFNAELHQTIARGLGEIHLDVNFERMKRKFGVSVETEAPKIAYRETLTKEAKGRGRFKKQSGGRGQFGDCWVKLGPKSRGDGYEFVNAIKGGVIPGKYVPSVDRGIREAAEKGILAGFPVVDFQAECYDGSYHSVDSSDIAFKVAGSLAFQSVASDCGPVILEPVMEVEITAPEEYMGDIIGDVTQRRGRPLGTDMAAGRAVITARVPEAELYRYASSLRSITQGRGHHARTFVGYHPVPHEAAKKIIAETESARS